MTPGAWRELRTSDMWWMISAQDARAADALGWGTREGAARLLGLGDGRVSDRPGRTATAVIALPGRDESLHVRRALHGGVLAPLWRGRLAGPRRVREELLATAELLARDAPVPRPVLGVALRSGALWRASLATVHIEDAMDGITYLSSGPCKAEVEGAAAAVGQALRSFHDHGGRHRDLHLGNLLVRSEPTGFRAWVIDLDRARVRKAVTASRRRRELARLARSLRKRGLIDALGEHGLEAFRAGYGCDRPAASTR